ncbi:MAG: DMT family transporter [Planctomycetia bacterium]|nr:DMT family transporter [Planctomycetia bacterium]
MNDAPSDVSQDVPALSPVVVGTACCIVAALGYTGAHICLRKLAVACDPAWVTCVKASVAMVAIGPWIVYRSAVGRSVVPPRRALVSLILVGLLGQVCGNLSVQFSLRIVGLAVTVPVLFGTLLVASALMGRILLAERISTRTTMAIGVSIASVALLGWGAGNVDPVALTANEWATGNLLALLAIGAACLAGVSFAIMSVVIRAAVSGVTSPVAVVFITTAVGAITLSAASVFSIGIPAMLDTPSDDLTVMLLAGGFNLFAYLALTKGLQLTTVVHANVLNASQVAMCAVAGILLFAEPLSPAVILGIALTILGTVLIDRPRDEEIVFVQE